MSDLAKSADDLRAEVARLRRAIQHLDNRTTRTEQRATVLGIGAAVVLLLLGLMGKLLWDQAQTANELENLTQRALCPVYALAIGSYDPMTRDPGIDRQRYEHAFDVMRDAYAELHCAVPFVPPRADG